MVHIQLYAVKKFSMFPYSEFAGSNLRMTGHPNNVRRTMFGEHMPYINLIAFLSGNKNKKSNNAVSPNPQFYYGLMIRVSFLPKRYSCKNSPS